MIGSFSNNLKLTKLGRLIYRYDVVIADQEKFDEAIMWCKERKISVCCKRAQSEDITKLWDKLLTVDRSITLGELKEGEFEELMKQDKTLISVLQKVIDNEVDIVHVYSFIRAKDATLFKMVWS